MTKLETAYDTIDFVRQQTNEICIFLSLGKDSLVTLDMCYGKFDRIVCVFMYWVKGLGHIQRWINWVKARYPRIEFYEIPHWNLSYLLRSGLYCAPQPKVKLIKLADVFKAVRKNYNVEWVFLGMKIADGMNRNLMLKRFANQHYTNNQQAYPLALMNQREVLAYCKQHNIPEPIRYGGKASSGLGFSTECLLWMYNNYPQDLELVYNCFPYARRVLFEHFEKVKREEEEKKQQESNLNKKGLLG